MNEHEITFRSDGLTFSATLALPDGARPFPAVLLIPGSGPVDRDENAKKARLMAFRHLAEHLASLGVASLRYDKRGVGKSEGDYWSCGFHDNRRDAEAAFHALRGREEVRGDAVFVLGHSEGTFHAAQLAADGLPTAGVLLVSGAARTGEDCLLWQGRALAGEMTGLQAWLMKVLRLDVNKQQRKVFEKVRASDKDVVRLQLVVKLNGKWFREFLDYDPAPALSALRVPTLAVTGSADLQTPPEDLERMKALNPAHVETVLVPGMSHLLRRAEAGGMKDYERQLKEPTSAELLELVGGWITGRLNGGAEAA